MGTSKRTMLVLLQVLAVVAVLYGGGQVLAAGSQNCQLTVYFDSSIGEEGTHYILPEGSRCPPKMCNDPSDKCLPENYAHGGDTYKVCLCGIDPSGICITAYLPDPADPEALTGGSGWCLNNCTNPPNCVQGPVVPAPSHGPHASASGCLPCQ